MIGGEDEEFADSVEILTRHGTCQSRPPTEEKKKILPAEKVLPADLPAGRRGHVAGRVGNNSRGIFLCGGIDFQDAGRTTRYERGGAVVGAQASKKKSWVQAYKRYQVMRALKVLFLRWILPQQEYYWLNILV